MTTRGHCLCKKTSWRYSGDEASECYCHCDDCRRNCAAPVVAWFGVSIAQFEWTGAAPKVFESSNGVFRHFCGTCGSPMAFVANHYPGRIHLYAASLEKPSDFAPRFHLNIKSKLPWLKLDDDLPQYEETLQYSEIDKHGDQN